MEFTPAVTHKVCVGIQMGFSKRSTTTAHMHFMCTGSVYWLAVYEHFRTLWLRTVQKLESNFHIKSVRYLPTHILHIEISALFHNFWRFDVKNKIVGTPILKLAMVINSLKFVKKNFKKFRQIH